MQTFKLSLGIDTRIVVPSEILRELRVMAEEESSPEYMRELHKLHPNDDDAFVLGVLRANIRGKVRGFLVHMLQGLGLGGSVSPVGVEALPFDIPEADGSGYAAPYDAVEASSKVTHHKPNAQQVKRKPGLAVVRGRNPKVLVGGAVSPTDLVQVQ